VLTLPVKFPLFDASHIPYDQFDLSLTEFNPLEEQDARSVVAATFRRRPLAPILPPGAFISSNIDCPSTTIAEIF